MTDFTPGPIITRSNPLWDGDRPSWLRDDVRVQIRVLEDGFWYGTPEGGHISFVKHDITPDEDAIRLDASDIVYRCIAWNEAHPGNAPKFPHYGSDAAPADWDGNAVLFSDGLWMPANSRPTRKPWRAGCIIGYSRRPTTSLPEPAEEKARNDPRIIEIADIIAECVSRPPFREAELRAAHRADQETAAERILAHLRYTDYDVPAYSAVETAKHYAELAGMVAVKCMTEREARDLAGGFLATQVHLMLLKLGIIRPDPTPLDIAKAEYPDADPAMIERIAAIVKGEGN